MRRVITTFLFMAAAVAAHAQTAPRASNPATADPCVQARADWFAIQRSSSVPVLEAYRASVPAACPVQRALAEARLSTLRASPSEAPPSPSDRSVRVHYDCTNHETVRVIYNHVDRTATLFRYARPSVLLQQTDAASGFRYHRADGYRLEGRGKRITILPAPGARLECRER